MRRREINGIDGREREKKTYDSRDRYGNDCRTSIRRSDRAKLSLRYYYIGIMHADESFAAEST